MKKTDNKTKSRRTEIISMAVCALELAITVFSFLYEDLHYFLSSLLYCYEVDGKVFSTFSSGFLEVLSWNNPEWFILFAVNIAVAIALMLISALDTDKPWNAKVGLIISGVLFILLGIVMNRDGIAGEGLEIFVIVPQWLISTVVEIVLFIICFFNKKKVVKLIGVSLFTAVAIFICVACYEFFMGKEYLCTITAFVTIYIFTLLQLLAADEEQPRELSGKEKAVRALATVLCAIILTSLSTGALIAYKNIEYQRLYEQRIQTEHGSLSDIINPADL